jgi:hypothetical protein
MNSKPVAAPRTNWPAAHHQTEAEVGVSLSESEAELLLSELAAGTAWLAATVRTAGDAQLTELDAKLLDQQLRLNSCCERGPSPRTAAQAVCLTHPKTNLNSDPKYLFGDLVTSKQCFGFGSGFNQGQWIRIRIRNSDSDSGSKIEKKLRNFMF